ncbi:MAG: cobalt-precorrin-6A reductase [Alphaproteobacteria bacterium]
MTVLILGGTAEARALAGALAGRRDIAATLSLAGRTAKPSPQPVPTRIGGFGGAEGLAAHLREAEIGALIDATHPYAAQMSENAARAAQNAGVPLLALRRPAWQRTGGDRWIDVGSVAEAVKALGVAPCRAFLALGRKEIAPFAAAPQHTYLVRSVDPIEPPLTVPHAIYLVARGPFSEAEDRALLERYRIDVIVAKNSGGTSTYGKIAAARAMHLPVVMLTRPQLPDVPSVEIVDDVLRWLDHAVTVAAARGV